MEVPTQIGRYKIVGHLASGGMAEILLGKLIGPSGFERPVVIKRILPHLATQKSFVAMFLDEARVIARMRHPNIVHVQELGQSNKDLFLVMEYLEGESLASIARRNRKITRRLDPSLAAYIVSEACAGLHAAHELEDDSGKLLGLVHRDVSPHNIFVTYSGTVKILDFGIAKFAERSTDTEAGQLKGKFPYMSPEQCLGKALDRRSDVFSLGTVLFELLTGRRLYARDSSLLTMQAIVGEPVSSPATIDAKIPVSLARICMRALAKLPEERYASAAEMRRDLVVAVRDLGMNALPEEALSEDMREVFADRIASKQELLRRVSAGSSITHVPEAEVDVSVELPIAFQHSRPSETPFAIGGVDAEPVGEGRSWAKVAVSIAVAASVAIGLTVAFSQDDAPRGGATAPVAAAASPPASISPTADPPPVAPTSITLRVSSTPVGARVLLDGVEAGLTPLEVPLTQGDDAIDVALEHDGYVTLHERVVPSRNERIVAALEREVAASTVVVPARPAAARTRSATRTREPSTSGASSMTDPSASPFRRFN